MKCVENVCGVKKLSGKCFRKRIRRLRVRLLKKKALPVVAAELKCAMTETKRIK